MIKKIKNNIVYKFFRKLYHFFVYLEIKIKNKIYKMSGNSSNIIFYHRVADVKNDPHLLSITPKIFREQMKFLKDNYNVVKYSDIIEKKEKNVLQNLDVSITFDDGYADNLYEALPILEEFGLPATIFVTVGKLSDKKPFDWDVNTNRKDRGRPLMSEELKKLATHPLIDIGSHTLSHPILALQSIEKQKQEIFNSKQVLESLLQKSILLFSYPVGSKKTFNTNTMDLVCKAGYTSSCTTLAYRLTCRSNNYALPRKLIRNWGIKRFSKELEDKIF